MNETEERALERAPTIAEPLDTCSAPTPASGLNCPTKGASEDDNLDAIKKAVDEAASVGR